jgi:hypothetical protein
MPDIRLLDHFVLYIDLLGTSDAANNWNEEKIPPLIDLLSEISNSRAAFDIKGNAREDGSYAIDITPDVSTFSDHIVASYPTYIIEEARDIHSQLPDLMLDMVLERVQKIVGIIAIKALNIGLLIRGGLTIGKLYHSEGVVFGEGMVDAYKLESRVAIYPRIVVSPRIYSLIPQSNKKLLATMSAAKLLKDRDGIWHLNYFSRLDSLMQGIGKNQNDIENWRKTSIETIDAQIKSFEKSERLNELEKWSWFKEHFTISV